MSAACWLAQLRVLQPTILGAPLAPGAAPATLPGLPSLQAQPLFQSLAPDASAELSISTPSEFYAHVSARVQQVVAQAMQAPAAQEEPMAQLLETGAHCLHLFLQHNLIGPWQPASPSPIELLAPQLAAATPVQPAGQGIGLCDTCQHPHDRWASDQLAIDGEEVLGSCSGLQYLLLAKMILAQPLLGPAAGLPPSQQDGQTPNEHDTARPVPSWQPEVKEKLLAVWPSWSWWALRVTTTHQQILEGRSARLWACTQLLTQQLASSWAAPALKHLLPDHNTALATSSKDPHADSSCIRGLAEQPSLLACLMVELALGQYAFGYVEPGGAFLREAGSVLGLQVQLTGALGTRTVYQVDPKAQLVVRATRARREAAAAEDQGLPVQHLGLGQRVGQPGGAGAGAVPGGETAGLSLEEDVLMVPKLLNEAGEVLENVYTPAEQLLLLSWAQAVKSGTAQDELQAWEMAPYVEAVLSQQRSQPMLQAHAQLLKIRHEKGRNRTRERALLHMEQLVDALKDTLQLQQGATGVVDPAVVSASRAPFCYSTSFPLASRLRKELAEQYMALGFVGAAVKMFEALEAWGALVLCYRLLEKKNLAEEIIQRRLKVTPDDPALWCSLGDLHLDDSYYETAWQRSKCRHARSKRSLGRSALRRKDWTAAAEHYEAALALNPLNPDAWFALGYAYLKMPGQHYKALKAFTRVTQQVPDHAEAWNNMAALWLDLGKHQEAFSSLSQCVKHKRDSWQVWENYSESAVRAGQMAQAVQGLRQVMQLSGGQRLPMAAVKSLLDHLEGHAGGDAAEQAAGQASSQEPEGVEVAGGEDDDLGAWVLDLPGVPLTTASTADEPAEQQQETPLSSKYQQDVAQAEERARELLTSSLGSLLKEGVNQPCCSPELWGCLGRYYALTGHQESAKEALLKQVRALTGTSYKSDEAKFVEMATASIGLATAYIQLYKQSLAATVEQGSAGQVAGRPVATRELAAARMHLRGVLKQCEQSFQQHPLWVQMDAVLIEVTQLEAEAAKPSA